MRPLPNPLVSHGLAVAEVRDPEDPRLVDYLGLTDVARRSRVEPRRGLFIAEGEVVLRRVLDAGLTLRSVLVSAPRVEQVAALLATHPAAPQAAIYVGSSPVLAAVTGFTVHRGVLAAVDRPPPATVAAVVAAGPRLLVLEGLNNPTNVGAVFRSAAALGIDGVLLDPTCYDPLYRRAVRVSMGAVLAVPWARCPDWPADLTRLVETGLTLVALTPREGAPDLETVLAGAPPPLAMLLGAEGPGLSAAALTTVSQAGGRPARIPQLAGVDSLNAAAAAAIACYLLGRRRGG